MGWKRELLREEELDELLEAAARHGLVYDFTVRTLAHTGLRAAEFAHLTSDWIDWQGEKLRVPPETDDGWTPKTDHAVRTIPLKETETFRVMREFFKRHEAVDVTRQAVRNRVVKVARDTEILKKVTPHVLRHTYGTLIAARATPQYIRQTMGHADLSSANNYLQYAGTQLDSEAEEL